MGALAVLVAVLVAAVRAEAATGPVVYSGTGTQQVADAIASFEAAIGGVDQRTVPGPLGGGFRTLNWDDAMTGVYSAHSSVSPQGWIDPAGVDELNFVVANARGVALATPGTGVEVSNEGFSDLNSSYPALLASPTGRNVFGPLGSTETDLTFEVPDPHTSPWDPGPLGSESNTDVSGSPATVSGVGVVFMNVEAPGTSSIEYLAGDGSPLGTYVAPTGPRGAPEFVGVLFDGAPVAAVRIISGTVPLSAGVNDDGGQHNVVALGDLVASEPVGGPTIKINPVAVAAGSSVTVTGTTYDPVGMPSVTVAGKPATVSPDGTWRVTLPSLSASHSVTATALDGRDLSATAVALRVPAPPAGPGGRPSTRCRVRLTPAMISVPDHAAEDGRGAGGAGQLTAHARCDETLRGVVTAAVTATASRSTRDHPRSTVARTSVLRSHPMTLAAGKDVRIAVRIPPALAARLLAQRPRLLIRLSLRASGARRAVATAVITHVRIVQRPG